MADKIQLVLFFQRILQLSAMMEDSLSIPKAGDGSHAEVIDPGTIASQPTDRWDAATWTDKVLGEPKVLASRHNLTKSMQDFLQEASTDDRMAHEASRKKVLNILRDVKAQHDARYPPDTPDGEVLLVDSIKSACRRASETAYEYTKIMDIMVGQAPEYVALAYGAVKILLVTHNNYREMKDNVSTWMGKIKSNFDLVDHLTAYYPSKVCLGIKTQIARVANFEFELLVDAIIKMYDSFQTFLAEALKFYTRSRLRHALTSFRKPWTKLEPIVDSIGDTCASIKDHINLSTHYNSEQGLRISQAILSNERLVLAEVKQIPNLVAENIIRFMTAKDTSETGGILRHTIEVKMEQHHIGDPKNTENEPARDLASIETPSLEDQLYAIFGDLRDSDRADVEQQERIEQLPEMEAHRQTKRSIWRANRFVEWLEANSSQLLWVDGGHVLQRPTFNASFVVPILIFGDSNSETGCLVLRHFCGDCSSIRPSNYRSMIQALLRQLLRRRPDVWPSVSSQVTKENAGDIRKLWSIFVGCIRKVAADCTFIVIDSIDCLTSDEVDRAAGARDFVLQELDNLVKESYPLVKILLTASLSRAQNISSSTGSSTNAQEYTNMIVSNDLTSLFTPVIRPPRRSLSLRSLDNEMALVPQTLLDIQERRRTAITFIELPMLYPVNSTIYNRDDGCLRAFVISELSGMNQSSHGSLIKFDPLVLNVWGVDHDGISFVKRHRALEIKQFLGEVKIDQLQYIPAGYLPDEHVHRQCLIRRGRRYWELGNGIHHLQCEMGDTVRRVVVDMEQRETRSENPDEVDTRLPPLQHDNLKPLMALTCNPKVPAYFLFDNKYRETVVSGLHEAIFPERNPVKDVLLSSSSRHYLQSALGIFQHSDSSSLRRSATGPTIVLLHGGPGVGKTTTVRSSAEHLRLPLLEISSGDIARQRSGSQDVFRQLLAKANRWRAVLSLENADMLFPVSKGEDDEKDHTTLKMIEALGNHHGLIFLVTDRIGVLASTLLTRVNFAIGLPKLDQESRVTLFRNLVRKIDGGGAGSSLSNHTEIQFDRMADVTTNGWDITTVMTTAAQLAISKGERLAWRHFEDAMRQQGGLQDYMTALSGGLTESDKALEMNWRADKAVDWDKYVARPIHRDWDDKLLPSRDSMASVETE